jgi:6,7-dimethyl-8-ribityllumazine synthase
MFADSLRQIILPDISAASVYCSRPCHCRGGVQGYHGGLVAHEGTHIGVVVGKFNSLVTNLLLDGTMAGLEATGVPRDSIQVAFVPGSFEIPVVAKSMAATGKFDAIIAIGAVVRGATTHYEEVCRAATSGCLNASTSTGVDARFPYSSTSVHGTCPCCSVGISVQRVSVPFTTRFGMLCEEPWTSLLYIVTNPASYVARAHRAPPVG